MSSTKWNILIKFSMHINTDKTWSVKLPNDTFLLYSQLFFLEARDKIILMMSTHNKHFMITLVNFLKTLLTICFLQRSEEFPMNSKMFERAIGV